jgi:hypothetical protein
MSGISIKYGGRTLNLEKSQDLVAIKTRPDMDQQLESAISSLNARPTGQKLGGFRVLNVG